MVKRPPKQTKKVGDIAPERLAALHQGQCSTTTYVEMTAIDFALLLARLAPEISLDPPLFLAANVGIVERMLRVGRLLLEHRGLTEVSKLIDHPSDTIRGWAAYVIAAAPQLSLQERLDLVKPLANDAHFGVREWAWLAIRPKIALNIERALVLLTPWSHESSANLRRFAVESTRPRGFWSKHISQLKNDPHLGLPLLLPLRADPARYVQDAVGNWLNDASKSQPDWVWRLCRDWMTESATSETHYIARRATRSLPSDRRLGRAR